MDIIPTVPVANSNIIMCLRSDKIYQNIKRDLENDVKNKIDEKNVESDIVYAIRKFDGWHRAMVKFVRKSDNVPVLQLLDQRASPVDFNANISVRKITKSQLTDLRSFPPAYFKFMIYAVGKYMFDNEFHLIFEQLFENQTVTGIFSILEEKKNILNECYVGDLFYEVNAKYRSFRELLIRENITFPSRVRTDINNQIFFHRAQFLVGKNMNDPTTNTACSLQGLPAGIRNEPVYVIGDRVNIFSNVGEGAVRNFDYF